MPTPPHIRDQAYQFFLEEAPELLHTIESGLLGLRSQRDTAEIHQIMRAAHSLKGGAASVGLEPIKTLAHRLEALFKALYSDTVAIDSELESQLLQAFDCLRLPLTQQLTEGTFDGEQALTQAEPILQNLEQRLASAMAETENFIPSSSDLGFNMATSIFEVDVQQGLDHLSHVLEQPEAHEVAGELRAQAEIFMGFAELLDLPGFAQIAETTLQALAVNPDMATEITRLAVADFTQGRASVLTASSTTGGEPSAALQALATEAPIPTPTLEVTPAAIADSSLAPDSELSLEPISEQFLTSVFGDDDLIASTWDAELPSNIDALAWLTQSQSATEVDQPAPPGLEQFSPIDAPAPIPFTDPNNYSRNPAPAIEAIFTEATLGDSNVSAPNETSLPHPTTSPSSPPPQSPPLTVRVDTQRLARLENQLGELTINRNGLALQTNQIRLGLKELVSRFERVRATVEQLQGVSDQILIAPHRQRQPVTIGEFTPAAPAAPARPSGFDSLEMDTYTALYTHTQTLLEEMVQFEEAAADITLFNRQTDQLLGQHRKMLSQVQDDLMYARMVPLGQVLNRFPRVLRDLAHTYGKPAALTLEGTALLVDKAVLEKLYDPLLHLLRNGFDHGLEPAEERLRQGKAEIGQITIGACYRGRQIAIEVSDDGRGLDLERVRQRLVDLNWLSTEEASAASTDQLSRYLFEPGFSTAEQVSDLSGRGVGLDVVRDQMQRLKGTVTVQSAPGAGTRFTLSLPMTLSIVNLLICFVGSTPIAFRSDSITEILVPRSEHLVQETDQTWLTWRDQRVPVYGLGDLLSYRCLRPELPLSQVLAAVPSPADWEAPVLILARGDRHFAIQVDRLVTEQESVIKPFGAALSPPAYAYGCTVLGDGSVIPVIDGQAFLDDLLSCPATDAPQAGLDQPAPLLPTDPIPQTTLHAATTVLVIDDAVTSRRTLALSLERAGYRVLQARDGQAGLEQLAQNPAVELVVCDIEMPNMNGFEFLTARRQNPALVQIPTLMLTSRSNDKHRWLAMQLGATDYFTKPYLEQEFLAAIRAAIGTGIAAPLVTG
ncbi:hybrid sensor histidine kinase/response regulator [Nodosilinea sp. FACHB-131]|uniref:hybrid sensor histidine kinase/response regulator n=1 Tax=Cyanophyceae TaxID=3028117 RepID=UPI001689FE59|nr:hybrid sensor histidine kinase/response regulator [Nodosilinea sp. FACHB-131]MBD1875405.1 hybrid sensor histidine kinase/response regulator [Nodosilinea sp. FACHB-131]